MLHSARKKLTARDATGKLTGTAEDAKNLQSIGANRALLLNELLGKFTGQGNNEDFAPPGGVSLKEQRDNERQAIDNALKAIQAEKAQEARQLEIINKMQAMFTPLEFATAQQTSALLAATSSIDRLILQLQATPVSNVPAVMPPGNAFNVPGKHFGGLLTGPTGYDNLLIRAEAGEFVMSQANTKKWLPQLIEMNNGRTPKLPGRFHEGGLVQTNVGDVNVTITGPVSPGKNVRQIGTALRREMRRGNLNLSQKGK